MTSFQPNEDLYPFRSNHVTLPNGANIHYLDEGKGPVLLLLHGNPAWSFLYRKIISRLSKNYRCIAPDLPGFGLSTAPQAYGFSAIEQAQAVVGFIEALDLQDVSVMMQDWGGPIGLFAAQTCPARFSGLIIGNSFAWPFSVWGPRIFSKIMGGIPGRLGAWAFNGVIRWFFTAGVVNKLQPEEWEMYFAPFRARASRKPTHIFPAQLTKAASFLSEIEEGLPDIAHIPALILWGDRDFAFKDHERQRFKAAFPNHRDITLSGAGHFIQEDAPDAICEAIELWHPEMVAKQQVW